MAISSFTYKPPTKIQLPAPPKNLYGVDDRPGLVQQSGLVKQYDALPGLYKPLRDASKASLNDALRDYGDFLQWEADDPNTPVDESLGFKTKDNFTPGRKYRDASLGVRWKHAARGALYSSFTDRDLGAEAARISSEAKQMVERYASDITDLDRREWNDANQITTQLTTSYGEDSKWLADRVPPKVGNVGSRPDGLFTWSEWLKDRTSKGIPRSALNPARFWDYIRKHGGYVPDKPGGL